MESIIVALITGVLTLVGVIVTNLAGNSKMQHKLEQSQAVTDTKIEELTREVREHNEFARRMPVLEEQVKDITRRIDEYHH